MRVRATALNKDAEPTYVVELFQDPKGHWFGSVCVRVGESRRYQCTATYTSPKEALDAAWETATEM